jgi:hypothetical protein
MAFISRGIDRFSFSSFLQSNAFLFFFWLFWNDPMFILARVSPVARRRLWGLRKLKNSTTFPPNFLFYSTSNRY